MGQEDQDGAERPPSTDEAAAPAVSPPAEPVVGPASRDAEPSASPAGAAGTPTPAARTLRQRIGALRGSVGRLRERIAVLPDPAAAEPRGRVPWRSLFAVVFALSLCSHLYGSAAPPFWGHYGYHTGEYGLRGRNCLRHGVRTCVNQSQAAGFKKPGPSSYYLHHPPFWVPIMAATNAIFGDKPVVVRLTGMAATMLALFAVFSALRRFWDPAKALAGALIFALLPHVLMFGTLPHTEQPALALGVIALTLLLRYFDEQRWWQPLVALICVFLAGQTDWIVYITFDLAVLWWFVQAFRRWLRHRPRTGAADAAQLSRATLESLAAAALAAMTLVLALLHVYHVYKVGLLGDLVGAMTERARVDDAGSKAYLRNMWLFARDGFTTAGMILIGVSVVYGAGKLLYRGLQRRVRAAEIIPWVLLLSFGMYFFLFKRGMIVHRYRWWFFAGAAAFFLADFLVDLGRLLRRQVVDRIPRLPLRRWVRAAAAALPCAVFAGYLLLGAPHVLSYSRRTAGTYDPHYDSTYPQLMLMQAVRERTKPGDVIQLYDDLGARLEMLYLLDRDAFFVGSFNASSPPRDVDYLVFSVNSPRVDHKAVLARFKVEIFGHFWLVHLDRRGPDLTVYGLQALETDAWWWFFCSSWYPPVRWVNSGPVRAQQMFEYYGLPTKAPTWESASAPRFLQAAYLKARQRDDQAGAESYLEQLRHAFPGQHSIMLTPEIELLGYVFHPDVQGFEVYFHVRGPVPGAKWVYFLHTNRSSDGAFRDLGGAVLDWTAGSVVRAERFVWESGEAALRIGLWRAPDEFAPPKSGKEAGVLMGRIDLGTQYKF